MICGDKRFATCRDRFADGINFRGFPHIPGNDFVIAYPVQGNDRISVKRERHLTRYFREFCDSPLPRLSHEKFKKEGSFSDGRGGTVAIWEFKAWQFRLYGAIYPVNGKKCFVGTRVDSRKKQNDADQGMLRNAALDIAKLADYRPSPGE